MTPEIKVYLDLSRGSKNYSLSEDEVIASLSKAYRSTLDTNNIEIVVISSNIAKNELVTCNNGKKTIIWDTNYWMNFAYYYLNLKSLNQHVQQNSPYCELQCDALWRDLFRNAFLRVNKDSLKHQLQFIKYYLSYGMRSFPREENKERVLIAQEKLVSIATAKMYAFLHELAHITAEPNMEYYIARLKHLFSDGMRDALYKSVVDIDYALDAEDKKVLYSYLDEMGTELYEGNLTKFHEIIADMRAFHSMCTTFIHNVSDFDAEDFVKFKEGIVLQRSFNLRIRNIEACLREMLSSPDLNTVHNNIMNSQFGKEFVIRDRLSEVTEIYILHDSFKIEAGTDITDKYFSQPVYSRETAQMVDKWIGDHLGKLHGRIAQEKISVSADLDSASEILDYLLFYPAEDNDFNAINKPVSSFGWSGLFFDGVIIES